MIARYLIRLLPFLSVLLSSAVQAQPTELFKKHVHHLSSDQLEGRGQGTLAIREAARYIAEQYEAIGLEPGITGSFFQEFPVPGQCEPEVNVIGILRSERATSRSIVFTAHYDAYGIRQTEGTTDSIYNGALDNAAGVAALIELARLFSGEGSPDQHLVFVATAAEEFGTYGSQYYVEHPIFPTDGITICLNMDGFNVAGEREDYFLMPRQGIDFVDDIQHLLSPLGWVYNPPDWVDQMNTLFDTRSFLVRGIPAITIWVGNRLKGGLEAERPNFGPIHSPKDEVNEHWDWSGVMDHLLLYKVIADHYLKHAVKNKVTNPKLFAN